MVAILEHMSALADPTRCRMLLLLEKHELTVSELCAVLQTPQSSVSRHLKTLADDDWVSSRRDGTSRFYSMPLDDLDSGASRLWPLDPRTGRGDGGRGPGRAAAARRAGATPREVAGVLRRGRGRLGPPAQRPLRRRVLPVGRARPDRSDARRRRPGMRDRPAHRDDRAVRAARHRGRRLGRHARRRAPPARRVDRTSSSGRASSRRCRSTPASSTRRCSRWSCTTRRIPRARSTEVARVVRPGGRVLVVDMLPHEREEYQQQMGHVWLGFSEKQMSRFLTGAGFDDIRMRALPADPDAKGPALFAAVATSSQRADLRLR